MRKDRLVFFRRKDLLVIAALFLVAGVWLAISLLRPAGPSAVVSRVGDEPETVQTIRLDRDAIYMIEAQLPVTLEVMDGAIRFTHSQCPDHLCEGYGWLWREGDWAACLPAGIVVRVE